MFEKRTSFLEESGLQRKKEHKNCGKLKEEMINHTSEAVAGALRSILRKALGVIIDFRSNRG